MIAEYFLPAIKVISLLLAVWLVRKKGWPYPLAALIFAVLPLIIVPAIDPLARSLVLNVPFDFGYVFQNIFWPSALTLVPAAIRFVGGWILFWLLDKYEDTYIDRLILIVGCIILAVVF